MSDTYSFIFSSIGTWISSQSFCLLYCCLFLPIHPQFQLSPFSLYTVFPPICYISTSVRIGCTGNKIRLSMQVWCTNSRPEDNHMSILADPHSLPKFRVIGPLSNSNEFAAQFKCRLDTAMNPAKKCEIW